MKTNQKSVEFLNHIKWWDFEPEYLVMALPFVSTPDMENAQEELEKIALMDLEAKNKVKLNAEVVY